MVSRRAFIGIIVSAMLAAFSLPALLPLTARQLIGRREEKVETGSWRVEEKSGLLCLPLPRLDGSVSLEEALANRRSIRSYTKEPLTIREVAQILWAGYGITETRYGFKTTPSAGATYPLEFYAVVAPRGVVIDSDTEGFLEPGSYHYNPYKHCLEAVKKGELIEELYEAGLRQPWIKAAPLNIVITADYTRTTRVYGERGIQYVHIEVGHAGQNIYLQATALGLATVAIGAFYDELVRRTIGAPPTERPLYIMPIGRPIRPYRLSREGLEKYYERKRAESR